MYIKSIMIFYIFFFQAEDGIRDLIVTGVQTCALPIYTRGPGSHVRAVAGVVHLRVCAIPTQGTPLSLPSLHPARRGDWGSEEGRVGEEGRSWGGADHLKKKK